jgi:hypothetical protein
MSKLWKASGICERALRKIGAFSINDTAADPEELSEALYWLDLTVAELAGTERCHWLIPQTLSIALSANTVSYDLSNSLGVGDPTDGVLFPIEAWVRDSSGNDEPVEIIRRRDYEDLSEKDAGGTPDRIYIDRLNNDQNMFVYPVPTDATYSIRLVCQTYAANMLGGTPDGGGNLSHGFSAEWQRWLILQNASDIGSGPVRHLPPAELNDIRQQAAIAKSALMAYSNREKVSQPRRTRAHGV